MRRTRSWEERIPKKYHHMLSKVDGKLDIYTDIDGIWGWTADGYLFENECRTIHEYTLKDFIAALKYVVPGRLEEE